MKRKKMVLEIPHVDNTYKIKNSFGWRRLKWNLLRKKLENFWAKFFNAINVYEINRKWKQRKMKSSKEWFSELWTQFMQLRKRNLKKLQNFNGIWTSDLAISVRSSPTKLWSHWCWEQVTNDNSEDHSLLD